MNVVCGLVERLVVGGFLLVLCTSEGIERRKANEQRHEKTELFKHYKFISKEKISIIYYIDEYRVNKRNNESTY